MSEKPSAAMRLILLYILKLAPAIRYQPFLELALGTLAVDYFGFQEALAALRKDQLLSESADPVAEGRDAAGNPFARFTLTPQGQNLAAELAPQIPETTRRWLEEKAPLAVAAARASEDLFFSIQPAARQGFLVHANHLDRGEARLLLTFWVPTEERAEKAVLRLRTELDRFYRELLALTGD